MIGQTTGRIVKWHREYELENSATDPRPGMNFLLTTIASGEGSAVRAVQPDQVTPRFLTQYSVNRGGRMTDPEVIIVGAGPVGLGAALELARFGIRSVIFEKHESTSWHPKTRNLNTRTMEITRGWGRAVHHRLRSIDTPPGWKSPIRFLDSATGRQVAAIESHGFEGPGPDVSPAQPVMSSQELIEAILLDASLATGLVDVRFQSEAVALERGGGPDDTTVVLRVRSRVTGAEEALEASALVAADGAGSTMRDELGLRMEGVFGRGHLVNCYFRAAIEPLLGDRTGVLFFVANDRARGVLQPLDAAGRWLCQIGVPREKWSPEAFTKDDARDWVRAAVGVDNLEVEVISLGFWQSNAIVADRLVSGRVVVCGDAAHQFPPTGGLGVNTGLQGMHNVMWKLAFALKGFAGWRLVETYDVERRALAREIANQSLENSVNVGRIHAAAVTGGQTGLTAEQVAAESRRYGNHLGVELGATYSSDAVLPDGTLPPAVNDSYSDYVPSATPGRRAPHVWLGRRDGRVSTLDLFGPSFTLLAGPGGSAWGKLAREYESTGQVPLGVYQVGSAGLDDAGDFCLAYDIAQDGAVLVRPDGHVAMRSPTAPEDSQALTRTLARVTSG